MAALAAYAAWTVTRPYAAFTGAANVDIPKRTGTRQIARLLVAHGVLRDPFPFLLLKAVRPSARLQAGEYRFTRPASPAEVFDRIARGDVHFHEFTVPEGSNIFDVIRIVSKLGFISENEIRSAVHDPGPIRDLAPSAASLEGYLYPSTYRVTRQTTARQITRMMTDQFRKVWAKLDRRLPVHEAVTLASLVEKETGLASERPLVASVYRNRLRLGIRLECDPTTIYAALLEGRYRGAIYRSDLASEHPYNTYRHAGLPPGPIASPGEASLRAALDPPASEFVFFVAKGDGSGGHRFSTTLAQHTAAVAEYRRGRQIKQARALP